MIKFEFKGGDNTRFVEASLKKIKKIFYKDKQLKATLSPQYYTKPSKLKHDAKAKRIYIRKKFGGVPMQTPNNREKNYENQD